MIIGAAALVAAAAAFMLWSRGPTTRCSTPTSRTATAARSSRRSQQMNVPYKFAEGGGAILIAGDKVPEVRLKLAAQGLPKAGGVGFELMDNQKFGTSQFAEQVNYQRGLEGELARSIESIGTVESARVHLALPKPSLFVRDQKKPSASVVLTLHRGRSIDEGQVSAIVHMISSSVPELDAKSVTVVDQRGNLLSAANSRRARPGREPAQVRAGDRAGLHPPHRDHPAAHRRREQRARPGRGRHRFLGGRAHRREVQPQPGPAPCRDPQPAVERIEPARRHAAGRRAGRAVEPAAGQPDARRSPRPPPAPTAPGAPGAPALRRAVQRPRRTRRGEPPAPALRRYRPGQHAQGRDDQLRARPLDPPRAARRRRDQAPVGRGGGELQATRPTATARPPAAH